MITLQRSRFLLAMMIMFSMCRKQTVNSVPIENPVVTSNYTLIADTTSINSSIGGYYVALPPGYQQTRSKYPLLVFLHGLGQMGDGKSQLKYLLYDGIGKVVVHDRLPSFTVNGEPFSFIVAFPQYNRAPKVEEVMHFVDTISSMYRVKSNRVYLSGLSLGARIVTLVAAEYPKRFAAIVPIAGVATNGGMEERAASIAEAGLPVWELHNADDPMANVADARQFIELLNEHRPVTPPRFTVFDQYGHDAWTKALDTAYREDGRNVYEWMLQYYR